MIADEETTCEPKRIRRFRFRNSIYHIFLFNGTDSSCLDIIRIPSVICGRSSPHIFCQNGLRIYQDGKIVHALLILIFCFIASITATICSEVQSLGKLRHHILLFEEVSPQISSFDMILESTSNFFSCHRRMFESWKQLVPCFRSKRCLTPRPHLAIYP